MKIFYFLLTIILTFSSHNLLVDPPTDEGKKGDIAVHVNNVQIQKGLIYVGLFENKKTFRKIKKVYKVETIKPSDTDGIVIIEDVPYDEYALVIFQDLNGNQKFDKNFMGVPKEPFGFSTNFKVSTRAPEYHEVAFEHKDKDTELKVELQIF